MSRIWNGKYFLALATTSLLVSGCRNVDDMGDTTSIKTVIDQVVTRISESYSPMQSDTLGHDFVLQLFSEKEKQTLATAYWVFDVNVPVRVSVMRHNKQEKVPFWLESGDFRKTDLLVKNELFTYEVWQKEFPAGRVNLGINGFDKHRPVYFVSLKGLSESDSLNVSPVFPEKQHFERMEKGAFTYHDWDGLKLEEVPEELKGETLLTTIRGRAREAHLVKAFRDTPFPSSDIPDQVLLTWSGDPASSQDIQWRTNPTLKESFIEYWKEGSPDTLVVRSEVFEMEDRLLRNDRFVSRHTVRLKDLTSGTTYQYRLGNKLAGWTAPMEFQTAERKPTNFSYIWFGDTHHSPVFGEMLQKASVRHPDVRFYQIAGDLVSTGLHRDDWDKLFAYSGSVFSKKALMAIPGNHDNQDGLGAWMYKEMFSYPENGPAGLPSEMTYAYEYGNALFLMIDATQPVEAQTAWIEEKLSTTQMDWKLVMFHFPPYNFVEPYPEIIAEWGPVFDKHHVDIVMSGHMHYYLRTQPIYANKTVDSFSKGTVYMMSISIEGKQEEWPAEDYAVVRYPGGPLYQHVSIQGRTLKLVCYDPEGTVKDKLTITKK
jgi:predicted phosphodiesterase